MGTSHTERHSVEADQNRPKKNNGSNNNSNENDWNKWKENYHDIYREWEYNLKQTSN